MVAYLAGCPFFYQHGAVLLRVHCMTLILNVSPAKPVRTVPAAVLDQSPVAIHPAQHKQLQCCHAERQLAAPSMSALGPANAGYAQCNCVSKLPYTSHLKEALAGSHSFETSAHLGFIILLLLSAGWLRKHPAGSHSFRTSAHHGLTVAVCSCLQGACGQP